VTAALDTYAELVLAEGKLLRWDHRDGKAHCALQPRDAEILVALARYRFLTTGQIAEIWWDGKSLRAARRRMTQLFEAGLVERFRPQTLRGSYQWTYCLARDGFRAAQQTGQLSTALKYAARREQIFDYRYVLHDLRVNEWVLRYRELLGERLLDWAGPDESRFDPPRQRASDVYASRATQIMRNTGWNDCDLADAFFRPIQPDALLDIWRAKGDIQVFVEYDRTRRVDKNYDKFRRYEALITCWWRATNLEACPAVVFICQDEAHRIRFLEAADRELVAYLSRWTEGERKMWHVARERTLFVLETEIREGDTTALRLPYWPPRHEQRETPGQVRRVQLPGITD
jgi:hypothetical protein